MSTKACFCVCVCVFMCVCLYVWLLPLPNQPWREEKSRAQMLIVINWIICYIFQRFKNIVAVASLFVYVMAKKWWNKVQIKGRLFHEFGKWREWCYSSVGDAVYDSWSIGLILISIIDRQLSRMSRLSEIIIVNRVRVSDCQSKDCCFKTCTMNSSSLH